MAHAQIMEYGRILVAGLAAGVLVACAGERMVATVPGSSSTSSTSTSTSTSTTSTVPDTPGVDERHGTFGGIAWTLITRTTAQQGELCMDLHWDDRPDGWQNCYPMGDYPGPLVWTDPTLLRDGSPFRFVVGLAPADTTSIEVRRGETTLGSTDEFFDGRLVPGKRGFVVGVTIPDTMALQESVEIPGLDQPAVVGVLPPMEVVALGDAGVEVARQGRLVGAPVDIPYVVIGADPATALTVGVTASFVPSGGIIARPTGEAAYGYVVVSAGSTAEVHVADRVERRPLVALPGTSPTWLLAVVAVDDEHAMGATFIVRDDSGDVIEELVLGQFLSG